MDEETYSIVVVTQCCYAITIRLGTFVEWLGEEKRFLNGRMEQMLADFLKELKMRDDYFYAMTSTTTVNKHDGKDKVVD